MYLKLGLLEPWTGTSQQSPTLWDQDGIVDACQCSVTGLLLAAGCGQPQWPGSELLFAALMLLELCCWLQAGTCNNNELTLGQHQAALLGRKGPKQCCQAVASQLPPAAWRIPPQNTPWSCLSRGLCRAGGGGGGASKSVDHYADQGLACCRWQPKQCRRLLFVLQGGAHFAAMLGFLKLVSLSKRTSGRHIGGTVEPAAGGACSPGPSRRSRLTVWEAIARTQTRPRPSSLWRQWSRCLMLSPAPPAPSLEACAGLLPAWRRIRLPSFPLGPR